MEWEFLIVLLAALIGTALALVSLGDRPLVSVILIVSIWLGLIAAVTRLEKSRKQL